MPDYQQLWDKWISGSGWRGSQLTQTSGSMDKDRIVGFYDEVVGPAFGGEEDFGKVYEQYIGTGEGFSEGWTNEQMELAEREFRMSIGDPYKTGENPFSWERISRMTPDEAQNQLVGELYGQGKMLGGELGAEYGTSTAKELESYTAGLAGEREGLTYGALTAGVGLTSGTSGATIRSGGAAAVSEDILIEAYKKAKSLGSEYQEGMATSVEALESDMDAALTKYLDALNREKGDWYETIKDDVLSASRKEMWEFETGERWEGTDWGDTGLEYVDEEWAMRDEACGIGMLWDGDNCVVAEEVKLTYDAYGYLCPEGNVDECGECGGDNSSCADCAGTPNGDAIVVECGVCGGDGSSCADDTKDDTKDIIEGETDTDEDEGLTGSCIDSSDCGSCERCDMGFCVHVGMNSPNGCDEDYDDDDDEQQCPQGQIKTETGDCIDDPRLEEEVEEEEEEEVGEVEVYGCSDKTANNYNPAATVEDGSCEYDEEEVEEESCVETGCSQYGPQYVCNEETGYCQDPDKFKDDTGQKPGDEGEIDCPWGQIWDGSNCVFPSRDEIKDGEECAGGLIMCGGDCICLPGEICSEGECIPEDTD